MNQGFRYREEIGPHGHGKALIDWLAAQWEHSSREDWLARIAAGEVHIGDRQADAGDRLVKGQSLTWDRPPWEEPAVPMSFEVIFEDADLLVVAKPGGLPTVPAGGFLDHTLLALVRGRAPEATPMHRLGRGTSGIVVFARTASARSRLQEAWRGNRVTKVYRALASGRLASGPFTITTPIGPVPHAILGTVFAADPHGKRAISHVTVLGERGGDTLVEVRIETGRPHQIRIHMASAGHPLVGDPLYRTGGSPAPDALPGDGGYLLHAARIGFVHPGTGAEVVFACAPPPGLLR